ncbi:MAG: hypothetical protein K5656_11015 [Lachnospiraceae bacterium]|nr:hypothetical protein [Lachnospiraceae bacterium]
MENVKFIRCEKEGNRITMFFKICDGLAEFMRKTTNYSEEELSIYLDEDNIFSYFIQTGEKFIQQSVVDTIEKISNEGDDTYF